MTEPGQPKSLYTRAALWVATGFGFGYSPLAPGTIGAIWGIPLALLIMLMIPSVVGQIAVLTGLYLVGIPICTSAARSLGKKDPGAVVWDEIVTVPMVFLFVESAWVSKPVVLLLGFALHRVFDVAKPWPIKKLEALPDGTGIMSDDVVAGAYACVTLHLLIAVWVRV